MEISHLESIKDIALKIEQIDKTMSSYNDKVTEASTLCLCDYLDAIDIRKGALINALKDAFGQESTHISYTNSPLHKEVSVNINYKGCDVTCKSDNLHESVWLALNELMKLAMMGMLHEYNSYDIL